MAINLHYASLVLAEARQRRLGIANDFYADRMQSPLCQLPDSHFIQRLHLLLVETLEDLARMDVAVINVYESQEPVSDADAKDAWDREDQRRGESIGGIDGLLNTDTP